MANKQELEEHGARIYCARGAYKWGLGFTQRQALEAANGVDGDEFVVTRLPLGAHAPAVDNCNGSLHWIGGDDVPAEEIGRFRVEIEDEDEERDCECLVDLDRHYEEVK